MKTRKEYAADFDTSVDYARFWDELSTKQRTQAFSMFGNSRMHYNEFVYFLGTDGSLLARRSLDVPTHGGPRPGAGRPHLDGTPPGEAAADPSQKRTVTMPASMWDVVKNAGDGVYSAGMRTIIDEWRMMYYVTHE
jgi:hypothetical protein